MRIRGRKLIFGTSLERHIDGATLRNETEDLMNRPHLKCGLSMYS